MALDESSCMMFDSNSQYLTNGGNKIEDQESSNDFQSKSTYRIQ